MKKQYGSKKGERVFYASINKGNISGAEKKGMSHKKKFVSAMNRYMKKT